MQMSNDLPPFIAAQCRIHLPCLSIARGSAPFEISNFNNPRSLLTAAKKIAGLPDPSLRLASFRLLCRLMADSNYFLIFGRSLSHTQRKSGVPTSISSCPAETNEKECRGAALIGLSLLAAFISHDSVLSTLRPWLTVTGGLMRNSSPPFFSLPSLLFFFLSSRADLIFPVFSYESFFE